MEIQSSAKLKTFTVFTIPEIRPNQITHLLKGLALIGFRVKLKNQFLKQNKQHNNNKNNNKRNTFPTHF